MLTFIAAVIALLTHQVSKLQTENAQLHAQSAENARRLGTTSANCEAIGFPSERRPWSVRDRKRALGAYDALMGHWAAERPRLCRIPECNHTNLFLLPRRGRESLSAMLSAPYRTPLSAASAPREATTPLVVNGKVLRVDDIVWGYEQLFERFEMHSMTTFMGIGLQQDPLDALAISDLLWRVRPRLVIELGTSGGGSALFYARVMRGYDPHAAVLTIDPAVSWHALDGVPLRNWNWKSMDAYCPHCGKAKEHPLWAESITFLRADPASEEAFVIATERVAAVNAEGYPVLVIEDSDHKYQHVLANIEAYASFVSPGSYFIVQDTRGGRFPGPADAIATFIKKQPITAFNYDIAKFVVDRRPEVFLFSQHSGGFLRRLEVGEVTV